MFTGGVVYVCCFIMCVDGMLVCGDILFRVTFCCRDLNKGENCGWCYKSCVPGLFRCEVFINKLTIVVMLVFCVVVSE